MVQRGSEFNISMFIMEQSSDFQFWEGKLPSDAGMEVAPGQGDGDCRAGVCSPPFWRRKPVDFRWENSPLLPNKHYSCPSPTSRLRAIVDGRRELMEMIKGMPESSYELSLKDLVVDDQQSSEEDVQEKEVIVVEDTKANRKMESRIPHYKNNNYSNKSSHISRTESMDSEVFLLKIFLPTSLSSKKKPVTRKLSKLSPGCSPQESKGKNWWKIASLALKSKQNGTGVDRSASDVGNNSISEDEDTVMPCRCSFMKKSKSGRQTGCLF